MESLEAIHDRLDRAVPFDMSIEFAGEGQDIGKVIDAVIDNGGRLGDVEPPVAIDNGGVGYALRIFTTGDDQFAAICQAISSIDGAEILETADPAMVSHLGGACEMRSRLPIDSNTDLRIVYTPGVARVCKAIEADPIKAREYTNIANKVAIATNGTAVLGLGDIGPVAGLPVMEGKAAIFWEFAGISADPVLIDTQDPDEFINIMEKLACGFGAIQVEDVKAPECFKITRELISRLDMPIMHDDQYGTATVVLAGLFSALNLTGKKIENITTAICGAGAAGTAIADMLLKAGAPDVILCDSVGIIHQDRKERMNEEKTALAQWTNKSKMSGTIADAMKGAELFIGVSQPNIISQEMVKNMAKDPIIFALANPVSEISKPDALSAGASIYADGRMMNNALAYPGIFRGALDTNAKAINMEMMTAAAGALANVVEPGQLMPEMMNTETHDSVARAVVAAAEKSGVARA